MKDAEHLAKLLAGSTPTFFKSILSERFDTTLPDIDPKAGKRSIRARFAEALSFLPVSSRHDLDDWAERVILLTDAPGMDAVKQVRQQRLPAQHYEAFDRLGNQYDRSLWLLENAPALFTEALNARLADVYRQKSSCYSGYTVPKNLSLQTGTEAKDRFHQHMAKLLKCPEDQVAIDIFERTQMKDSAPTVSLYQINIHHNLAPEAIDCVKQKQLDSQQIIRAISSFVTYEPTTGYIEVLSKERQGREHLVRAVAEYLLSSPIDAEQIPIKFYDYQFLSEPVSLDIADEPIDWVKVVRLGYANDNRVLEYRLPAKETVDIHARAREDIHPQFRFSNHELTMAWITVRFRRQPGERARSARIVLRGDNGCNINTKREKDRQLCNRLLQKWGIVQEVSHECSVAANDA